VAVAVAVAVVRLWLWLWLWLWCVCGCGCGCGRVDSACRLWRKGCTLAAGKHQSTRRLRLAACLPCHLRASVAPKQKPRVMSGVRLWYLVYSPKTQLRSNSTTGSSAQGHGAVRAGCPRTKSPAARSRIASEYALSYRASLAFAGRPPSFGGESIHANRAAERCLRCRLGM